MTIIEKVRTYEPSAMDETRLPTLKCTRLHNRRSSTLDYRLKKAGFIACDFNEDEHPRAWKVAWSVRPALEQLIPAGAYISWNRKRRARTIRPKVRDKADRPIFVRGYENEDSTTICTVCFNPLTGVIYVAFEDIDLSKIPFCVRDAMRDAYARKLLSPRVG
jgi:hypothetical protein